MTFQLVEAGVPGRTVRSQPSVEFTQRIRGEPVEPALLIDPHPDQARLPEHPQVLGDGRLAMNQPAVSKHLRVLREAGLVRVRVDEQRRLYRLTPDPLRELDRWLAPYRAAWDSGLDKLERHLDQMDQGQTGDER